jgi:hypothetical protein
MHDAFTELGEYAQHVIETTGRSPEEVRAEYLDRRRRDEFRLDTRVLASRGIQDTDLGTGSQKG